MKLTRLSLSLLVGLFTIFVWALPAAAQDATAEPAVQTYKAESGPASVKFPAGWVFEAGKDEDSFISFTVANKESALAKDLFSRSTIFASGEVHVEVAIISLADLADVLPGEPLTPEATPLDIVQAIASQGLPDEFTFGDPGTITINDNPAVRMNLTAGKRGEGQLLLVKYSKDWVGAIILYAAAGEGDKWDLVARDILASVKFNNGTHSDTQTQTTSLGHFTVSYPLGWEFDDRTGATTEGIASGVFASNHLTQSKNLNTDDFESGDIRIELMLADLPQLQSLPFLAGIDATTSMSDVLLLLVDQQVVSGVNFGTVQPTNLFGAPGAQVGISGSHSGDGRIIVFKRADGLFIYVLIYHASGELQSAFDEAYRIVNSLVIASSDPILETTSQAPLLTQTTTTTNGLGALSYPENWFSRPQSDHGIYLSNNDAALNKSFGSVFKAGEVNLLMSVSATDDFIKEAKLALNADASPLELLQATIATVTDTVKFGTPVSTTIGDKRAASVDFSGDGFEGTAWLVEYQKGAIITVQLLAAAGEGEQWQSTALAIIQSVRSTD